MKQYKDLSPNEQALFNKIELIFRDHPSISKEMFSKVLFVLGNKYKQKVKSK